MPEKRIRGYGQQLVMACDGRCDKAWGINGRPKLFFMEKGEAPRALIEGEDPRDEDDYVWLGDDELGTAPADPGTYEGGYAKPSAVPLTDPEPMNKWCFRECERSESFKPGEPVLIRDLKKPEPNIPRT